MLLVAAAVSGLATVASSAAAGELLPHGDFSAAITPAGALPANWTVVCANNATCPTFGTGTHKGSGVLTATGNGRAESYGWIEATTAAPLVVGETYCFGAELDYAGIADLQRHTRIEINGQGYFGGVFDYHRPAATAAGGGAAGWVTAAKQFKYGWPAPMSSRSGPGLSMVCLWRE
jgi:hypothetical protein